MLPRWASTRDQRRARRLAERRGGDRGAGGALGGRQRVAAAPQPGAGDELQRLDAQLLAGRCAGRSSHGASRSGSSPGSASAAASSAASRSAPARAAATSVRHRLDVDPDRLGEDEPQRVAALEHRRLDGAAQAREHRGERRVARRRALVRPQRLDQLVAADRPAAVQHEVGERQPALAAAQLRLAALAGELHAELATEMDASSDSLAAGKLPGGRATTPARARARPRCASWASRPGSAWPPGRCGRGSSSGSPGPGTARRSAGCRRR